MIKILIPIIVFSFNLNFVLAQKPESRSLFNQDMDGMDIPDSPILLVESENNTTYFKKFQSKLHISIYPNPVIDYANLHFELQTGGEVSLEVFTLEGSNTIAFNWIGAAGKNNYEVDLRTLPIGNYLYVFSTQEGWVSGKLIKRQM
ncbi:MAG: T9SS type A sorting domain-containing protein [Chitinophagales bacterium]